jgi:hypothetical protein
MHLGTAERRFHRKAIYLEEPVFLDPEQLVKLTDRRQKSAQIAQLRKMGIPFFVNASGHPVVTESSLEGKKKEPVSKSWSPSWAAARP